MTSMACCMRTASRLKLQQPSACLRVTTTTQTRQLSSNYQRSACQSRLYLDFLAPSWTHRASRPRRVETCQRFNTSSERIRPQRPFSSSATRTAATAITNPRTDENGEAMIINITPRAAHRLQAIAEKEQNQELALRVSVESGGCHGFQYLMKLINMPEVDKMDDTVFESEDGGGGDGDYRVRVVMDEPSLELLKGSSIDYTMELIGSQFKVTGIPGAKSSCGCGTSFDIAE